MANVFNNREIAVAIWIVLLLGWLLFAKTDVRKSAGRLILSVFHYKLLLSYSFAVGYTFLGVYLLSKLDLWTVSQLKDTIIWCVFTIISTITSLNSRKDDKKYFREAVKKNFKASIVTEFIIGVFTFSLLWELIFVPVVMLIALVQVFTEKDKKQEPAHKLAVTLLTIIGVVVIWHTINQIINHSEKLTSLDALRDFILSPFLALWILPYLFMLALYMAYENNFITMNVGIKDTKLLSYAKWQALLRFNVNTQGFNRWRRTLFIDSLETKAEVIQSIKEIKRLQKVEQNPPEVDFASGWSPYAAKDFLTRRC